MVSDRGDLGEVNEEYIGKLDEHGNFDFTRYGLPKDFEEKTLIPLMREAGYETALDMYKQDKEKRTGLPVFYIKLSEYVAKKYGNDPDQLGKILKKGYAKFKSSDDSFESYSGSINMAYSRSNEKDDNPTLNDLSHY